MRKHSLSGWLKLRQKINNYKEADTMILFDAEVF